MPPLYGAPKRSWKTKGFHTNKQLETNWNLVTLCYERPLSTGELVTKNYIDWRDLDFTINKTSILSSQLISYNLIAPQLNNKVAIQSRPVCRGLNAYNMVIVDWMPNRTPYSSDWVFYTRINFTKGLYYWRTVL